jgi:lysophospholipase L1-like esterase
MTPRLPGWLQNLGLCCVSLLVFFALCELVIFRLVLPASDVPQSAFIDGVIRHEPNQRGVYRYRDEIAAPFAINRQGWNSGIASYRLEREPGVGRVAVIGDSYVEATEVPFHSSFAELTQQKMLADGCPVVVQRFGMSGAPLSQYLHVLEREVIDYRPDWVVVLIVHNDFQESFQFSPGRYSSSFLKLRIDDGVVTEEVEPLPYKEGPFDWLRWSATLRYLYYTQRLRPRALRDLILGKEPMAYEANIDVDSAMLLLDEMEIATDHVLGRMAALAAEHGSKLLLVMDGHRQAIYGEAEADPSSGPLAINALVAERAAEHGLPFIDLHRHFAADWQRRARRFEHESDWHWNAAGHELVARVLSKFLSRRCPSITADDQARSQLPSGTR